MRASWVIAFLLGSATTTWSEIVYYATFTGENYAKKTWHSLRRIRSVFVTFAGITTSGEAEGLTRCVRTFSVSPGGTLRQTAERITDKKSGRVVAREFYQPRVEHWMTLSQLPIPPDT